MIVVTTIALAMLAAAGVLCLLRMLRPATSTANRIVALDMILAIIVSGVAVAAAQDGDSKFLDALVVTALLGFVTTVTVARFIERRGV